MRFVLLIFILILTTALQSTAQIDSIRTDKGAFGATFHMGSKKLKFKDLKRITLRHQEAHRHIKKAGTFRTVSGILAFPSGFLIGWPAGAALAGKPVNWWILGSGLAGLGVVITCDIFRAKNTKQAVSLYNQYARKYSYEHQPTLRLNVGENGIGLALEF